MSRKTKRRSSLPRWHWLLRYRSTSQTLMMWMQHSWTNITMQNWLIRMLLTVFMVALKLMRNMQKTWMINVQISRSAVSKLRWSSWKMPWTSRSPSFSIIFGHITVTRTHLWKTLRQSDWPSIYLVISMRTAWSPNHWPSQTNAPHFANPFCQSSSILAQRLVYFHLFGKTMFMLIISLQWSHTLLL